MNLIKRDPNFFDTDLMDLPSRMFGDAFFRGREFPLMNFRDLNKEFQVELATPGYRKEDLKVDIADGMLTVSCERKQGSEKDEKGWRRQEFSYNSFSRSFQLPENADPDNVKAAFKDGVLKFTIAKKTNGKVMRAKVVAIQ